jgi:non-ribosomal peptide synthetase component F
MFALQNTPEISLALAGLELRQIESELFTAKFDLSLFLRETATGLEGTFEYATDLFERASIVRLAERFERLLYAVAADPAECLGRHELLGVGERTWILDHSRGTTKAFPPDRRVHELFARQAGRTPNAPAVTDGIQTLSFGELERRANRLAHHLISLGVGPESVVGVCLDRSPRVLVALLAILKAGGAYLPLDAGQPVERLTFMLKDAGATIALALAA